MDLPSYALVFLAAIAAGVVNSIAGGGTILTFPAALAVGLSPVVANATNCVALVPGSLASAWAYRRELARWGSTVRLLIVATGLGGLVGAVVLLATPERWFDAIVPWLIFTATLLVTFQGPVTRWTHRGSVRRVGPRALVLVLFGIGVYGGYFGAGQGIFMLGAFSLVLSGNLHEMNALKAVAASFSNGFAAVYFLARGVVDAPVALTMAAGAIVGGFLGASIARQVNPRHVRVAIIVIGLGLTAVLLERAHRVVRRTTEPSSVSASRSGQRPPRPRSVRISQAASKHVRSPPISPSFASDAQAGERDPFVSARFLRFPSQALRAACGRGAAAGDAVHYLLRQPRRSQLDHQLGAR